MTPTTYKDIHVIAEVALCFYATHKVHRKDVPVRPIVSVINSITYGLDKHLTNLLNSLVSKRKCYIKSSEHLVKLLSGTKLEDDDVTALFISVLCDEVVEIAVKRARN